MSCNIGNRFLWTLSTRDPGNRVVFLPFQFGCLFSLLCLIAVAITCSVVLEQGAQCRARRRLVLDLRRSALGLAPPCIAHRMQAVGSASVASVVLPLFCFSFVECLS